MKQFTIKLNDAEKKALLTDMVSIQEWVDNVIHNKARQCIDKIIKDTTDKQPNKMSVSEKQQIVINTQIESAAERNTRLEADLI